MKLIRVAWTVFLLGAVFSNSYIARIALSKSTENMLADDGLYHRVRYLEKRVDTHLGWRFKGKIKTIEDVILILSTMEKNPEIADYWQSPEETLRIGGGDCEDIAILGDFLFTQIGLKSYIFCMTSSKYPAGVGHAIIVFKDHIGYSIYSHGNKGGLHRTFKGNMKDAIEEIFPEYEELWMIVPEEGHQELLYAKD